MVYSYTSMSMFVLLLLYVNVCYDIANKYFFLSNKFKEAYKVEDLSNKIKYYVAHTSYLKSFQLTKLQIKNFILFDTTKNICLKLVK